MTSKFPAEFKEITQDLLREEFSDFWRAISDDPSLAGLRVNTLKTRPTSIINQLPGQFSPLPWTDEGFLIDQDMGLSKHVFHAAGLYYLQEPSAMVPVTILDPRPGERILDLCAAPGGKSTQILSQMENQGWLLANDPNPKRIQALMRNIDRWGARKFSITCETPERLFRHLGPIFDRVLVDAPCSGEATFRSDPKAVKNWSLNFTDRCARIQDEILWYGSKLVRPGGVLVYSTCTFNTYENEETVARFLEKNPSFQLDSISLQKAYQTGINPAEQYPFDFNNTVRIWPHKAPGEGHFIARLKNTETKKGLDQPVSEITPSGNDRKMASYKNFFDQTIQSNDNTIDLLPQNSHLIPYGNQFYSIPPNTPDLSGLRVKHWGWWIGTLQGDEFIPSPALASGLSSDDSQKVLEFSVSDPELQQYHRGSPIKDFLETRNRSEWVLITVDGITLGWGKANKGKIKSYLPSWLRTQ